MTTITKIVFASAVVAFTGAPLAAFAQQATPGARPGTIMVWGAYLDDPNYTGSEGRTVTAGNPARNSIDGASGSKRYVAEHTN